MVFCAISASPSRSRHSLQRLGEVTTAGQYPFINGMTVENAVAVAGGFTPRAYKWSAELTRVINDVPVVATVPITQPVQPGDTVTIRERFF